MGNYFEKYVNGDVRFYNLGQSKRDVRLIEHITGSGPEWQEFARVKPGDSHPFNCDGHMRFQVDDREFRSAGDVAGGIDMHWDDVWGQLRHK